jgi:hypothetical protein
MAGRVATTMNITIVVMETAISTLREEQAVV